MLDRFRNVLANRAGWNFLANGLVCAPRAIPEGGTVTIRVAVKNVGGRVGTVYVRFLIAPTYDHGDSALDTHSDLAPGKRQALRIVDIAPGESREVVYVWTVPIGAAHRHFDVRAEVWNPHLLFGGSLPHRFDDTGWIPGFETVSMTPESRRPVFISYSYDSETHLQWVVELNSELLRHGIPTLFDRTSLRPGHDISHFIERAVTQAAVRLLICSNGYTSKANSREVSGVGFETVVSANEYYHTPPEQRIRFVPIVRGNTLPRARRLPVYLGNALYVDMEGPNWRGEPLHRLLTSMRPLIEALPPAD